MTGERGQMQETEHKPMDEVKNRQPLQLRMAPRCQSISRQTKKPCGNAAERGKIRCRFHGARAGAPKGNQNGFKHGRNSAAAVAERKRLRELLRSARELSSRL